MDTRLRKGELLYPLMVIAAIAVTVFSLAGVATMMGWMPRAFSVGQQNVRPEADERSTSPAAPTPAERKLPADGSRAAPSEKHEKGVSGRAGCLEWGTVESVRAVELPGETSWMGTAGGAVVGGLLGNQIGSGGGRAAATIAGAAGGAYAGNEIERHVKKSIRYRVRVRMDDGSYRTYTAQSRPGYGVGQKVRVTDQGIVAGG